MKNDMIPIGNGSFIKANKICVILPADSTKIRRILKKKGIESASPLFWDTSGELEIHSLIVQEDGMLVTSFLSTNTIAKRVNQNNNMEEEVDD